MLKHFSPVMLCVLLLLPLACAQLVPPHIIDTAGRVAHVADQATAAVVKSLTAGVQAGTITPATAQAYVEQVAPTVQASLDGLRALLQALKASPGAATAAQVTEAVLLVQESIATAQAFSADPDAWIKIQRGTP